MRHSYPSFAFSIVHQMVQTLDFSAYPKVIPWATEVHSRLPSGSSLPFKAIFVSYATVPRLLRGRPVHRASFRYRRAWVIVHCT